MIYSRVPIPLYIVRSVVHNSFYKSSVLFPRSLYPRKVLQRNMATATPASEKLERTEPSTVPNSLGEGSYIKWADSSGLTVRFADQPHEGQQPV